MPARGAQVSLQPDDAKAVPIPRSTGAAGESNEGCDVFVYCVTPIYTVKTKLMVFNPLNWGFAVLMFSSTENMGSVRRGSCIVEEDREAPG